MISAGTVRGDVCQQDTMLTGPVNYDLLSDLQYYCTFRVLRPQSSINITPATAAVHQSSAPVTVSGSLHLIVNSSKDGQ